MYADPTVFHSNDAPTLQILGNPLQVGEQQGRLSLRTAMRRFVKEDHGWLTLPSNGEQGSKIRIRRYYDSVLISGPFKYLCVICSLQTIVSDMHGVMSCMS